MCARVWCTSKVNSLLPHCRAHKGDRVRVNGDQESNTHERAKLSAEINNVLINYTIGRQSFSLSPPNPPPFPTHILSSSLPLPATCCDEEGLRMKGGFVFDSDIAAEMSADNVVSDSYSPSALPILDCVGEPLRPYPPHNSPLPSSLSFQLFIAQDAKR